MISMIFWFSSHISSSSLEVFHRLILLSAFPFQSLITGLGGFLPATWSFETHQLPHKARIFSQVSWFPFSVSLFRFKAFLPGSHSRFLLNKQLPCSAWLASKKESNCNIMVMGPTNHIILTCDHSHDLLIWSQHVTYELYPDIKPSLIPTSMSSLPSY